ncbi:hypothetical protein BVRB_4g071030 isoform A [Beta vulgaris subsp. vulgaris]|nr:hypothetical protein BVRB_4g071030 isoform A [Beta vulgaris subsp. vulgaris]
MGLTCNCAMGPLVVGIGSVAPARRCPPTPTSSQMENWRSLKTPFDDRCPVPRLSSNCIGLTKLKFKAI